MAKKSVEQEIAALRELIREHDRRYYVEAAPTISDLEYDKLLAQLKEREAAHPEFITRDSPTQRVAGEPIEGFRTVRHARPMYSIDNTYDLSDLRKWAMRAFEGTHARFKEIQEQLIEIENRELEIKGRRDDEARKMRLEFKQRRKLLSKEYDDKKRNVEDSGIPIEGGYLVDPKVDGVAINLRYEAGRMALAATRGDGRSGDDVTNNIRASRSVPDSIKSTNGCRVPSVLEVRAEVYMPTAEFVRLNNEAIATGREPFANPRNATAGTLKQLDPNIVARRRLKIVVHGRGEITDNPFATHSDFLDALKDWGIPTNPVRKTCATIDDVWHFIEEFATNRGGLDYGIDGVVVRVNRIALQEQLGYTSKFPRWCIAYKYAAEQATTRVINIDWQIGKTGKLTPRAIMEPVFVAGTTVRHASLHNLGEVSRKDIRIGDTVVIEKAGEIIPQVIRVVIPDRPETARPISPPTRCPECDGDIDIDYDQKRVRDIEGWEKPTNRRKRNLDGVSPPPPLSDLDETGRYCINPECPAQLRQRLLHFAGRGQMDIDGLGETVVSRLVEREFVRRYGDLYRLTVKDLTSIDFEYEWGESGVAKRVSKAIEESKSISVSQLIEALVPGIGKKTAIAIAGGVNSIGELFSVDIDDLLLKPDVTRRDAERLITFLKSQHGKAIIGDLAEAGVKVCVNRKHITKTPSKQQPLFSEMSEHAVEKCLERFVTKSVKGLGRDRLATIIREGLVHSYGDIYTLDEGRLANLIQRKRMSAAEADAQLTKIAESKTRGLQRLLTALSIRQVGARLATVLAEHFKSMTALQNAKIEELTEIDEVGKIKAHSVYTWLHSKQGQATINDLKSLGVKMEVESPTNLRSQSLASKTFVVTGTLTKYSRDEIQNLIEQNGGRVTSSVSRNTNYLIAGSEPGETKFSKAKQLGITILSEDEFEKLLSTSS